MSPKDHGKIEKAQFADARDFLPTTALLFSSEKEAWGGGVLSRFRLQKMPDADYSYSGHMLALPHAGTGELTWQFDGRKGTAPVRPGTVSIQPAERFLHRCTMRDVVCDTLHLEPAWMRGLVEEELPKTQAALQPMPCGEDRLLRHWMDLLVSCVPRRGELGAPLQAEEILARIGVHLLQNHCADRVRVKKYERGLEAWRLRRVFEFVEMQSSRPISLAAMAGAAGGMSVFHFSRLFRQSTGMTPHQYVQRSRLSRARILLESGARDLLEVALETGFCDHSHLTRSFKRGFGITPSEYQRRGKSKNVQTRRLVLN